MITVPQEYRSIIQRAKRYGVIVLRPGLETQPIHLLLPTEPHAKLVSARDQLFPAPVDWGWRDLASFLRGWLFCRETFNFLQPALEPPND